MAMRIFEFRCQDCGGVHSDRVNDDVRESRCKCGGRSVRIISAVRSVLDPIKGHFPGATLKWARHHERAAQETSE